MSESPTLGLYDGFAGYRSATEEDLREAITGWLVVLDTNVLLSLYNFQGASLEDFIKVFDALGDRLFVPHQVLDEFWRNRRVVLSENQGRHREQEIVQKAFDDIESALRKWHQRVVDRTSGPPSRVMLELEEARTFVTGYMFEKNTEARATLPDTPTHEDRILEQLEPILQGKVGTPPAPDALDKLKVEGKARVAARRPPGYMDGEKNPDRAIGDFLVWRQTMEASKARGLPVLLVTQDQKEDWWADRGTKAMRARPELVSELEEFAGQRLLMVRAHDLVRLGSYLGVEVSQATVDEAAITSDEGIDGWTSELVDAYLEWLAEWPQHFDILNEAVQRGGRISRAQMARILGREESAGMPGVGRPYYTAIRRLVEEGWTEGTLPVPLSADYATGGWMSSFDMPGNLVPLFKAGLARFSEEVEDVG